MTTALKPGDTQEKVWDFDHHQLSKEFKKHCAKLGLDKVILHMTRHSGPAIDRALNLRSQEEVQKRGQWRTFRSVLRYEKSGRLAADFEKLDEKLQTHCHRCASLLAEVILGETDAPIFV